MNDTNTNNDAATNRVLIQCPHCGVRYPNIPENYLGRTTRCKVCRKRFRARKTDLTDQDLEQDLKELFQDITTPLQDITPTDTEGNRDFRELQELLLRIEAKLGQLLEAASPSPSQDFLVRIEEKIDRLAETRPSPSQDFLVRIEEKIDRLAEALSSSSLIPRQETIPQDVPSEFGDLEI